MTRDEVRSKLAVLSDNLERLAELPQGSYDEFIADFRNLDSALHRLQTSIQVLVDLASFAVARHGLGSPTSSFDAIERLEAAGHLPAGAAKRFAPVLGFRNRIVHLYDRIDPMIVFDVLTRSRPDLEELGRRLAAAIASAPR